MTDAAFPYEDNPSELEHTTSLDTYTTTQSRINYICPECGGGFKSWDHGTPKVAMSSSDKGEKRCPFCHTEAGNFGDDDEEEQSTEELKEELEEARETIDQLEEALEEVRGAFE